MIMRSAQISLFESLVFRRTIAVLLDAALIVLSMVLAYGLRIGTLNLSEYSYQLLQTIPVMIVIRISVFAMMGLYRGMWRFVGMRDLILLVNAITISSLAIVVALFFLFRLEYHPRSVFFIDWFVILVLVGGSRFAYRYYRDHLSKKAIHASGTGTNVLIVGAGRTGDLILREILGNYQLNYHVVGFVDDNRKKRNLTIHGYLVLGNTRDIPRIVAKHDVKEIFLAIPTAPTKSKRRIMHICKNAKVKFKTLPDVGELLTGRVRVSDLREFQIEDILGRDQVRLDTVAIREYIREKTVLITGAGGSIGSELCRQVAQFMPKRLVLYEQSEYNLYQIVMNLEETYPDIEVRPVIGDILNQHRVEQTMKQHRPEVIFHAAAYKHVPLMEQNPDEAIRNNAFGTWTMAYLAQLYGVKKFVMISTDKAVRPTNIMGASKRISELICQGFGNNSATKFVTVRFGNVLNSVGSVIPLFKRQIAAGGPVTVTHPDIFRYFMTIPEAVQLILQAGAMGQGNEIFLLDMGEPIRIADLARDMITLSGLEPDKDIKIVYTGLRPGEKLYEELLIKGEEIKSTLHDKIKVASAQDNDFPQLLDKIDRMLDFVQTDVHSSDLIQHIREIVPEYHPEKGGPGSGDSIQKIPDKSQSLDTLA